MTTTPETAAAEASRPAAVVIGCGLMGAALATAIAESGHPVVVWNRTPERAHRVAVHPNITAVDSFSEAVHSSALVITCLGTYADVRAVFESATLASGATLVNLTTGTPEDAEHFDSWLAGRAIYLDGAILAYPQHIGTDDGVISLSGAAQGYTEHAAVLHALGKGVRYLSGNVGAANVLDTSIVGAFYISSLTALIESAAYALERGVDRADLMSCTHHILGLLAGEADVLVGNLAAGTHTTDQATLAVYQAATHSYATAVTSSGWRARMVSAALDSLDEAVAAGHGESALSALAVTARQPAAVATS